MKKCIRCHSRETKYKFRICDECLSANSKRKRRPRITPKELVRGTRWSYNRIPTLEGTVNALHVGGYVHVQVDDDHGDFTWISSLDDFLLSWTKINSECLLDIH
jgi:hypothetical protein